MDIRTISLSELADSVTKQGLNLPIEQTAEWSKYQNTIEGRTDWGTLAFAKDGKDVAYALFIDYLTHGYHYLSSIHGPVWLHDPSEKEEMELSQSLVDYLHKADKKVVFVRMGIKNDIPMAKRALSITPYDHTVILDVTGGDDEILKRMKPRGRRDVRKSLRESPAECADETEQATKSFKEYYAVMEETGKRDDFIPSPLSDYENMIRILGPEHCRVYAARVDGKIASWSIVTISGKRAVRYYGASATGFARMHVTDKLVYFEECDLGANKGVTSYDMMGIGSALSPQLMGLNEFKCKFSKETFEVAPQRDLPVHPRFYSMLVTARKGVVKLRACKGSDAEKVRDQELEQRRASISAHQNEKLKEDDARRDNNK